MIIFIIQYSAIVVIVMFNVPLQELLVMKYNTPRIL